MKRRVISLITALALCLNLGPAWAVAAGPDAETGLCPHHRVHTEECGYVPPVPAQDCIHEHDDSCAAPDCTHVHDETCGYAPAEEGAACTFACRVCPVEELLEQLPGSVTPDNAEQTGELLRAVLDLYTGLTEEEQELLDLSLCLELQAQLDAANTPAPADVSDEPAAEESNPVEKAASTVASIKWNGRFEQDEDTTEGKAYVLTNCQQYDLGPFSRTATTTNTFEVKSTGALYLYGSGAATSQKGSCVVVESGGQLYLDEKSADLIITGSRYGLDIQANTTVQLSGGTITGNIAAIRVDNGEYSRLLKEGYAFFDLNDNPIPLQNLPKEKTVIVKKCTEHPDRSYMPNPGTPTHTWTCQACGNEESEPCTFDFDKNGDGTAKCDLCEHEIRITIDLEELIYNNTVQPGNVGVAVTLDGGSVLAKDTDYKVEYTTDTNAGNSITVTVTGETYNGTFTKTYDINKAKPEIKWTSADTVKVTYTGSQVLDSSLPAITITAPNGDSLKQDLVYSYKKQDDSAAAYTAGLPTNAGTYDIIASLPEMDNYFAASSEPLTLEIEKADPNVTAPTTTQLTYNRNPQPLVAAGKTSGGTMVYSTDGTNFSEQIPVGTDAGTYTVSYKVIGDSNYNSRENIPPVTVTISPKEIMPKIEVSESSYVYDGSAKKPQITVRDGQTVIEDDQYTVTWTDKDGNTVSAEFKDVGTYTATITNISTGNNYEFTETATVEIVNAAQNGLKITGKPANVYYGDVFTLDTVGGTGNGSVMWSIDNSGVTIGQTTGELTVKNIGTFQVTAKRTVPNYGEVEDTWTFTVKKKPVTAVVTGVDRDYIADNNTVEVKAEVRSSDLVSGDNIKITGLTGKFNDANVGTNKLVAVNSSNPVYTGSINDERYEITYPATTTATIKPKKLLNANISITLSGDDKKTDADNNDYWEFDGTEKRPVVTVEYTENGNTSTIPASEYTVDYSNNISVGTNAAVTVTAKTNGNYQFDPVSQTFRISKSTKAQVITPPAPAGEPLTFSNHEQTLVIAGTASGGTMVYSVNNQNGPYSKTIPTAKNADTYKVYYKVKGNDDYADSHEDENAPFISVTIEPKRVVDPIITLTPGSYIYDGNAKTPAVIVKDGNTVIQNTPTEYTLRYSNNTDAGIATVHIENADTGNYIVNGTKTFEIAKATAEFTTEPQANTLTYNSKAQYLVTDGAATGGTKAYSLDGVNYDFKIPTGTNADTYKVWCKVIGDKNHTDSVAKEVDVTIGPQTVTPIVKLTPSNAVYDSTVMSPTVTVEDLTGHLIPESEYIATYDSNTDWKSVGSHTVTIEDRDKAGKGNYTITPTSETFKIIQADQTALTITGQPSIVYYGDTIQLGTTGGTGNGTVEWTIETGGTGKAEKGQNDGQFKIIQAGTITIKATRKSTGGYADAEATWTFTAERKPLLNPEITLSADEFIYHATAYTPTVTVKDGGTVIPVDVAYTDNTNAGTATVTITSSNYAINTSKEFTIERQTVTPDIHFVDSAYDGEDKKPTVTVTSDEGTDIPAGDEYTVRYNPDTKWENVGSSYTVTVTDLPDGNYEIENTVKPYEITQATPNVTWPTTATITSGSPLSTSTLVGGSADVDGDFKWDGIDADTTIPEAGDSYLMIFTPDDTTNYKTLISPNEISVTFVSETSIEPSSNPSNGNTNPASTLSTPNQPAAAQPSAASLPAAAAQAASVSIPATVDNGTAAAVVNEAAVSQLVKEAAEKQSKNVVIKPEISGDVTKTEVSIPAATVSQLQSGTDAALTVSTPIADVTIPNEALDTLNGAVSVVTEQAGNTVTVALSADGKSLDTLPGGLTLTVPVEDPGPGTAAVRVNSDGTREVIPKAVVVSEGVQRGTARKAAAASGKMIVPLTGSATVEIVDNSKEFADVPATSWAADAVAFASAHELFNGTSETSFSPELSMSRAMLATVLYNLEGRPARSTEGIFSDVSTGAWYAPGVSWAAANGIVNGYGGGRFGPDDSVTREQFAVMLWKYAGSPAAAQGLRFTDAGQASAYAQEALCWAAGNGILSGYGDGRLDPGGLATRAQAAQMMKNFMEII